MLVISNRKTMKKRLRQYSVKKKPDNTVSGKPGKKKRPMCFI